ncbi:alpha/beta hydrolase [Kribbella sp. NBC_01245]|uniref:alpha/beta fold hydrolase n=1 Tax=Kribbella sp. NBC_01245 TaxID=2903578 RepID=UPI002E2E1170|nr:alpha/beta hydrolase [Kribbella sp. NBC_01245]
MAELVSHEITVDEVLQRYHVAGEGPVLLVHSGGPGIHWEYLRMPVLEEQFTTVYVEPVGTGKSGLLPDGRYTMPRYASFAAAIAREFGPKVSFLGHSHGGMVGLQLAHDHPELLNGLVLYDAAPTSGADLLAERLLQTDEWAKRRAGDPNVPAVLAAFERPPTDKASFLTYLAGILPIYFADFEVIKESLTEWMTALDLTYDANRQPDAWDIRPDLPAIAAPTLVLVGEYDFICGPRWAREMAEAIPGAKLTEFANAGHFGHLEVPELFFPAVTRFVSG